MTSPILPGKRCCICKATKPVDQFHKNKAKRDGLQNLCKDCVRAKDRQRILEGRKLDYMKRWWRLKKSDRAYQAKIAAWRASWQERNPERYLEAKRKRRKRHYLENREAYIARAHAYRARLANAPGGHTEQEWKALCKACGGICLRCGLRKRLTRDHVIPLTSGGGNGIDNIQPLCKSCNDSKGTKATDYRPTA